MSFTISDLIVETLEAARRPPCVRAARATRSTASPTRCAATGVWRGSTCATRRRRRSPLRARRRSPASWRCARRVAGPGNLHLINGLFDAHRSRVPVLAIAAHIPTARDRHDVLPGDASRRTCSASAASTASSSSIPAQLPLILDDRDADRDRAARRRGAGRPRRRPARRDAAADARSRSIRPTASVVRPSDGELRGRRPRARRRAQRVTILAGAGCAGAHEQVARAGRRAAGADRPRAARQGVPGVRQPVRRRHDRPARLQLGLPGDGCVRRAADARHRLPLPAVLSRGRDRDPGRRPRRADRPPRRRRRRAGRHGQGHRRGAAAQADREDRRAPIWTACASHYAKTREQLDEPAVNDRDRTPLHPQFVREDDRRARRPTTRCSSPMSAPRYLGGALPAR